jgi:ubiquinol-cytochrome c reductase cytochrome b subunit
MHYLFGVLTGLFVLVHIFTMHSFTSSNPLVNVYSAAVIPFYPLIFKDLLAFFALLLSAFACTSYFEPELLGNCENLTPANPLLTIWLLISLSRPAAMDCSGIEFSIDRLQLLG